MYLFLFLLNAVILEFIELPDKQVHWRGALGELLQHVVSAFTSLCARHASAKDIHEVRPRLHSPLRIYSLQEFVLLKFVFPHQLSPPPLKLHS